MANENANRFLRSYNKIEAQLKLLYGGKATQNFTDLVKRCTDVNITVRRYESELVDYGKLRNAIVHRTAAGTDLFIANPTDEATQNIEYIERQLCRPGTIPSRSLLRRRKKEPRLRNSTPSRRKSSSMDRVEMPLTSRRRSTGVSESR